MHHLPACHPWAQGRRPAHAANRQHMPAKRAVQAWQPDARSRPRTSGKVAEPGAQHGLRQRPCASLAAAVGGSSAHAICHSIGLAVLLAVSVVDPHVIAVLPGPGAALQVGLAYGP